nr:MAG TPA: hypothetical protein [Caudoviricetes sp.]
MSKEPGRNRGPGWRSAPIGLRKLAWFFQLFSNYRLRPPETRLKTPQGRKAGRRPF